MVAQTATSLWDKQKMSPSGNVADGMIVKWFKGRKQSRIQNQRRGRRKRKYINSIWLRKIGEEKICCKAIKYNSSCCGRCKERVIAMTHWCNPFKTLWLWPWHCFDFLCEARVAVFISDTIRRLPAISGKLVSRLVVHLLRASCPGSIIWLPRKREREVGEHGKR